ncbi:hypothetical protein B0H13DRAFT_2325910 [Mycena leptocephala]|nr:hypothetical protein B0H13DRAFT_2325910 [Mycena leptocephala]
MALISMQSIFTRLQTARLVHASNASSVVLLTPEDVGLIWAKFEVFSALFCAFIVEVIMQIRLHAMYGHDKRLIFVVSLLCIGELMSMASLSMAKFPTPFGGPFSAATIFQISTNLFILAGLAQVPNTDWTLPFCNNVIPNHFYPYWIAFMIFDMTVLLLVVRKAFIHYQTLPDRSWSNATLMAVLVRDSVFYFLCNVIVFLSTTLLWRYGPQGLATVANSWSLVVPSTSAGRLLLSMRNAYRPSSDRISTAGLSGLGSLHIICPDSQGAGESSGWPFPLSFGFLKFFESTDITDITSDEDSSRKGPSRSSIF